MSNILYRDQMSRAEFEERIKFRFGESGFSKKEHKKPQRKTLYYINKKHVGTWKSGKCSMKKS